MYGPKCNKLPWWVLAVVTKVFDTQMVNDRIVPKGPTWRQHIGQVLPRYSVNEGLPGPRRGSLTNTSGYTQVSFFLFSFSGFTVQQVKA